MPLEPNIRLSPDLQRVYRFFPQGFDLREGYPGEFVIDRGRYTEVADLLNEYKIDREQLIHELCFFVLLIENETGSNGEEGKLPGKYHQMWEEIDGLNDYLLAHRITSISLRGEFERGRPGEDFVLKQDINIDRLCDGIRSVFRDEFSSDKGRRRSKGLKAWKKRRMVQIRNNILNYFASVPSTDTLTLEDQNRIIDGLSSLSGLGRRP